MAGDDAPLLCDPLPGAVHLGRHRRYFAQSVRSDLSMIRPILTEILLFLTPFALYAAFLVATRAGLLDPLHWPLTRIISLAIISLVLMLGSSLYFANFTRAPVGT